jgi:hypothetical protein
MKRRLTSYTFDAAAKTVALSGVTGLTLEQILLVTNVTRGKDLYVLGDTGASLSGSTLTVGADTTGHANGDRLFVWIDDEAKVGDGARAAFSGPTIALPANTSTKIANAGDRLFAIINSGTGHANLNFGAAAVVDQGFPCDAASATGRLGTGITWDSPVTTTVDIFAISAAGTSMVVLKG